MIFRYKYQQSNLPIDFSKDNRYLLRKKSVLPQNELQKSRIVFAYFSAIAACAAASLAIGTRKGEQET